MKRLFAVLLVIAAGTALYLWRGALPGFAGSDDDVPTAPVRKGDLDIVMKARGDIKALHSVTFYAPFSVTEVKLVQVAKSGTMVKAGDVIALIDGTMEQNKVREQESNVKQADKENDKVKAQHRIVDEQARLDTAQARYDVQGASLETRKQEIVSEIEAGKARLTLQTKERHVVELENTTLSREDTKSADLNVVVRRRQKAERDMGFAKRNIELLTLKAPIDGMIVIMPNYRARMGSGSPPEFKAGDQAWPGAALGEIPDLKSLILELSIEETDRGKVAVGQVASVKVDAIPDRTFTGKIKSISTMAQMLWDSWPPKKNFKATVEISPDDARLRPNMSANADLVIEKLSGVNLIPSRAIFERYGRTVAWVRRGKNFEEREIVTGKKNLGQVEIVSGLQPGEIVSLERPARDERTISKGGGR